MTNLSAWPAVTYEARPWVRSGTEVASRRALMRARGNYYAAIVPHIEDMAVNVSPAVQALADDASRELARFDVEAGQIAAPFASILLRTESSSSSEVENLTASAKQVALAEIHASQSSNARLVVANVNAMRAALRLAGDMSEESILAMHHALLGESAPQYTGRFRNTQVWVGGGRISPHDASFVPPHHEHVSRLMVDLVSFLRRTDIPILTHAAITHAQFETIHPFPDGNGRTGRALIHSILHHGGLTSNVTVPVSAGLLQDPQSYFEALSAYREGHIDAIVGIAAEASFAAVENGRALVNDLKTVAAGWDRVRVRSDSTANQLKELLLQQPVVTSNLVAEELGVSTVASQSAIDTLVTHGVLTQTNSGRRNRIWHAQEVLEALDHFAARARRRRL